MRVIMGGKSISDGAMLEPQQTLYATAGTTGQVFVNLINCGENPVNSIEYTYTVGDKTYTENLTLDTPLSGQVGSYVTLDLAFTAPDAVGRYSIPVTVTKVNGEVNEFEGLGTLDVEVVPFLPVHRPLVEDYTGFWCGYCPEVYVLCKQMLDKYGHEFLSIAYHSGDSLMTMDDFPSSSYGLPKVYMGNRDEAIEYTIMEYLWQRERRKLAPADIDVTLYWDNADKRSLRPEASVKFVYDDPEAEYMLSYVVVEDDMSDPSWRQRNFFYNDDIKGPYWDLFCGKQYNVEGIIYDDVVMCYPDPMGVPGSLPSSISGGEEYTHSSVISLADATCKATGNENEGKYIIQDEGKLRVVALLIDGRTGYVCNAATSGYSAEAPVYGDVTGIECVTSGNDADVTGVEYYSLEGIRLSGMPSAGIYVVVRHMSDGTIAVEKKVAE